MTTYAQIAPIIFDTYGEGEMSRALVNVLATKIDNNDFDSRGREHGVMLMCWHWFSGGDTAEGVARRIEAILGEVT